MKIRTLDEATRDRLAADRTATLTQQQQAAMNQLEAAKVQLATIKRLRDAQPDTQVVDGPPAKRARPDLEDFKCDFGEEVTRSSSGMRCASAGYWRRCKLGSQGT